MLCEVDKIRTSGDGDLDASLRTLVEVANHAAQAVETKVAADRIGLLVRYFMDLARRHLERERKVRAITDRKGEERYKRIEDVLDAVETVLAATILDHDRLHRLLEAWAAEQMASDRGVEPDKVTA